MDEYTSEDARREWRRILNEVERGEPVGITRYGKPLAVVVDADWYATVIRYIDATTFTGEASRFYIAEAKRRDAGGLRSLAALPHLSAPAKTAGDPS